MSPPGTTTLQQDFSGKCITANHKRMLPHLKGLGFIIIIFDAIQQSIHHTEERRLTYSRVYATEKQCGFYLTQHKYFSRCLE
jgi:hypothetical protein